MENNSLVYNRKGTFMTEKGYLIGLQMKLWKFSNVKAKEFPEGYKFNWIVFNLATESEKILFDNHWGKSPHYHLNDQQNFFTWKSLVETEKLFYQMVYQKFGYFNYE